MTTPPHSPAGTPLSRTVDARWLPEDLFIRQAVVDSTTLKVHHGDHVRGILANETKELFLFRQLPANPLDLNLLMNAVDVKKKHRADESPNRLPNAKHCFPVFLGLQKGWQKGSNSAREEQGYSDGCTPQPPLSFLDFTKPALIPLYPYPLFGGH